MKPSAFRSQAGRAFTAHDDATSQQVAIVNQEFLRKYLNGKPAIGTHIRVHAMDPAGPRYVEREIVGVAGQVKVEGPGEKENAVEVYVPVNAKRVVRRLHRRPDGGRPTGPDLRSQGALWRS